MEQWSWAAPGWMTLDDGSRIQRDEGAQSLKIEAGRARWFQARTEELGSSKLRRSELGNCRLGWRELRGSRLGWRESVPVQRLNEAP